MEIGNNVGRFVASCPGNFVGVWRDYFRVRVTIEIKPLKRMMKIKKTAEKWYWISFKYENIPTFCFICGTLGQSENFCSKLIETPESEIVKPYGPWMRAPFKRQVKAIGAKWIRSGMENDERNLSTTPFQSQYSCDNNNNHDPKSMPQNHEVVRMGGFSRVNDFKKSKKSGNNGTGFIQNTKATISPINGGYNLTVIES